MNIDAERVKNPNDNDGQKRGILPFTVLNTNARSLGPKLESLVDCINEMDARVAIITESWLKDGDELDNIRQDLSLVYGMGMLNKNRMPQPNGVAYGGVALVWKESACSFKQVNLKNKDDFECLVCVGSLPGLSQKMVVVATYLPPNYTKLRGEAAISYIGDGITEVKRRYRDPFVLLAGDFNQWRIDNAVSDFLDVREVEVGCTRGSRKIDRFFCNFTRAVFESGTLAPLVNQDEDKQSDHRVAFFSCKLPRRETFFWQKYSYRHFNYDSANKFRSWIIMHDWAEVLEAEGSNEKN